MNTLGIIFSPDGYESNISTGRRTPSASNQQPASGDASSDITLEAEAKRPEHLRFYGSRSLFSGDLQILIEQLATHGMIPAIQEILASEPGHEPRQDPAMDLFQPASPQTQANMLASISTMGMTL
jgi:hypothetical protein